MGAAVFEVFRFIPVWTNKRQTPRKGVWCFTGKGDTWNYCSVPKCKELVFDKKVETNMNITKIEKESYPIIVMASIVLIIADFFVFVIILTITVSWCRGKEIRKEKETNELEELWKLTHSWGSQITRTFPFVMWHTKNTASYRIRANQNQTIDNNWKSKIFGNITCDSQIPQSILRGCMKSSRNLIWIWLHNFLVLAPIYVVDSKTMIFDRGEHLHCTQSCELIWESPSNCVWLLYDSDF